MIGIEGDGMRYAFQDKQPVLADNSFLAPSAYVIGDVVVGENSSIWYGCILRGDVNSIRIGKRVNIQDGTVIHVATHGPNTQIGNDVSVGHMALLHACKIESGAFIGMRAVIMDGAIIEKGAMVAAGALVPAGKIVRSGELWMGSPAKFLRPTGEKEKQLIAWTATHYVKLAMQHRQSLEMQQA